MDKNRNCQANNLQPCNHPHTGYINFPREDPYKKLCEKAKELKVIENFKTDLTVHDKDILKRFPFSCFIWMPYRNGTHMMMLTPMRYNTTAKIIKGWELLDCILFNFSINHIFLWSDGITNGEWKWRLKEVSVTEAKDFMESITRRRAIRVNASSPGP